MEKIIPIYEKTVAASRKSMRKFLKDHEKIIHNTVCQFANDVRIRNMQLVFDLQDSKYDKYKLFIEAEHEEFDNAVNELIQDFKNMTHYDVSFVGATKHHIVLEGLTIRNNDTDIIDDMETPDMKRMVNTVCAFDRLCDNIRELFIYHATNSDIETIEKPIIKKCYVARLKPEIETLLKQDNDKELHILAAGSGITVSNMLRTILQTHPKEWGNIYIRTGEQPVHSNNYTTLVKYEKGITFQKEGDSGSPLYTILDADITKIRMDKTDLSDKRDYFINIESKATEKGESET